MEETHQLVLTGNGLHRLHNAANGHRFAPG